MLDPSICLTANRICLRTITACFLVLLSVQPYSELRAEDHQDAMTLDWVIRETLASNLGMRISRVAPEIADTRIIAADAQFDFEVFGSGTIRQSEQQRTFSQTEGTSSDQRNFQTGVRRQLSTTGGTVTAQTNYSRRDSDAGVNVQNLAQTADLYLSYRQPLLRNFGSEVTRAQVNRAHAASESAWANFEEQMLGIIAEAEINYWRLATARHNLEFRETSLRLAERLLDEVQERQRLGLATRVEVLQAEAARAQRQEEIIEAEAALENAYDVIYQMLNRLDETTSDFPPVSALPEDSPEMPEFDRVWRMALERNPSLRAQDATIRQFEYDRISARNRTRPQLDLVLAGAYLGLDDSTARGAYESALDRDGNQWSVGLEFNMPWGFRAERADLRQAEKQIEREEMRQMELRQVLLRDTRRAYRNFQARTEAVRAARITLELRTAAYEQELGKYENGLATFREVLEAQNELDQAQVRYIETRFNRIQAEIELERVAGSLPERHSLVIE